MELAREHVAEPCQTGRDIGWSTSTPASGSSDIEAKRRGMDLIVNLEMSSLLVNDEAAVVHERAIELAPRFADALYNLASLCEEIGDDALTIQHLRAYRDVVEGR